MLTLTADGVPQALLVSRDPGAGTDLGEDSPEGRRYGAHEVAALIQRARDAKTALDPERDFNRRQELVRLEAWLIDVEARGIGFVLEV